MKNIAIIFLSIIFFIFNNYMLYLYISTNKNKSNVISSLEGYIKILKYREEINKKEINELNCLIESLRKDKIFKVKGTGYTARAKECNEDFKNTAIMEKPIPGYSIAVSQDLIHLLGERVYIKGIGVRRVNDLMNKRHKNRIDILMPTVSEAINFGNRDLIMIVIGDDY